MMIQTKKQYFCWDNHYCQSRLLNHIFVSHSRLFKWLEWMNTVCQSFLIKKVAQSMKIVSRLINQCCQYNFSCQSFKTFPIKIVNHSIMFVNQDCQTISTVKGFFFLQCCRFPESFAAKNIEGGDGARSWTRQEHRNQLSIFWRAFLISINL